MALTFFPAGDAQTSGTLAQFAPTNSAEFASVISDETGTLNVVFALNPSLQGPDLGDASADSLTVDGTAGSGFVRLVRQSAHSTPPATGIKEFADAGHKFSWVEASAGDGRVRSFTGTLTADRDYTLPDADSTLPIFDSSMNVAAASGKIIRSSGTNFLASIPAFPNSASNVGKLMQSDGTNFIVSTQAYPTATPVSGKVLVSDGTNFVASTPTFPATASAISGKILQSDGTNWVASTPTIPTTAGTNGNILVSDGTNWVSSPRSINAVTGTSTSGTNGTVVALMTAPAGKFLHNFMAVVAQTQTANTNFRINIVYSDGTSTTDNSVYNQATTAIGTYGGIIRTVQGAASNVQALSAGKKVTSINVTTMGAGTGTRGATLTAEEIPLS